MLANNVGNMANVLEQHFVSSSASSSGMQMRKVSFYVSCLKALSLCLQQAPVDVLHSLTYMSMQYPGVPSLMQQHRQQAQAELGIAGELADAIMDLYEQFPARADNLWSSTVTDTDNQSSTATCAAAASGVTALGLLLGRSLLLAGYALQRVHERADVQCSYNRPKQMFITIVQGLTKLDVAVGMLLKQHADAAAKHGTVYSNSIAEMQQLHVELQSQVENVVTSGACVSQFIEVNCTSGSNTPAAEDDGESVASKLRRSFGTDLAKKYIALGLLVSSQLAPAGVLCCANPACVNCSKLSERELLKGKGTVCSQCKAVRLCSADCNKAYWKAGHKQTCKLLSGAQSTSTGSAGNSCSQDSTAVELPSSAAAAAALSVRQLKSALAQLQVGCETAVEKSDLVDLLVKHAGLQ